MVVVVLVVVCGDGGSCDGSGDGPLFSGWIGIKQMIHASSSGEGGRGGDTDGGIRDVEWFDGRLYRVNTTGTEDTEEADDKEDIGKSVTPIDTPNTIKKRHDTKQEKTSRNK